MLILEDILEKMKLHFPRWMDIRRKVNSSIGGAYLTAIAENITEIQSAIDDYKKDFFIDNYTGSEENILDFLYKVQIGTIEDLTSLTLVAPEYKITDNEDMFYNNDKYAYYNDGCLYFKKDEDSIIYSIDSYKSEGTAEKIHVWNIFDEFAIFLGLKRYQWETNKELYDRILAYAKVSNKVNSTEDGLKNAIIANLINIAPELKQEDILIERPTAENLVKYYDAYTTVLDHLAGINKDTYKEKQWDVDVWNFGLKSVEYIPHAWDIYLSEYVNGVGFENDLKVEILDDSTTTDVTIYFYKKQLSYLNDYIKNNNVRESFAFDLKKYNENIATKNVKYRVTASDAKKIDTSNISLKAIEERTGTFTVNIQDVIASDYDKSNIIETDYSILDNNYNYTIDFIPTVEIGTFEIDYCKQGDVNLLDPSYAGFESNGSGVISTASKKYISDLYQLSSYNNITKTLKGFNILDLSKESSLSVDVTGDAGKSVFYDYDYQETILDFSNFDKTNCYVDGNAIVSDTVDGTKVVSINLKANTLSFRIEGPYTIRYSINDGDVNTIEDLYNNTYDFSLEKSNTPRNIKLTVEFKDSGCKIKNTKYSKYDFSLSLANGSLVNSGSLYYLPNVDNNSLNISMKSYAGFSPILKYIYVGNKLSAANGYYGIAFNTINGTKLNAKYENCRLQLKKFDKSGTLIETINDYKPYIEYEAREDVEVELELNNYAVSSLSVAYGSIDINTINPINTKYVLTIPKGRALISFSLCGTYTSTIVNASLSEVLDKKGFKYAGYDFYITKNEDSIIAKDKTTGTIEYIKIYKEDLFDKLSTSTITIESTDNNIVSKFIQSSGFVIYAVNSNQDFSHIAFEPSVGNSYVAINEYNVLLPYTKDIMIVNTFNNNFNPTSTNPLFYVVESLNDEFYVRFQTNQIFESCDTKILDSSKIAIKAKDIISMNYNYDSYIVTQDLMLGSTVEIPQDLTLSSGSAIDIRQYVLSMNHTINYYNRYTDVDNYLDYIKTEDIVLSKSRVTKLKYSNVNEIESVYYKSSSLRSGLDYTSLNDEGIIIWTNDAIPENSVITITYNINIAKTFDIDLNDLYDKIQYPVNSLELMSTAYVTDIKANDTINLNNYEDYANADLVSFNISEAGFLSDLNGGILTLINNNPANSIAIKTGYYYMDGREFYLLANEKYDNINKLDSVTYHNVSKDNNEFILKMKTENFITNSTMELDTKGEIFNLNCLDKDIQGISKLNEITICETFNYWNTFACSLSISSGYNGQGLKFKSLYDSKGYCYLPLSNFIGAGSYVLSFFLSGECKAYLAKEKNINSDSIEFDQQSIIELEDVITLSGVLENIYEKKFDNTSGDKYYLVLVGSGTVDDIILVEEENYNIYNHVKNISLLNIDIAETIFTEYNTRLYITDKNSGILDGTEIDEDIFNSSYINWGYTKIKSFNTYSDFKKFILTNVDVIQYDETGIIKSGYNPGTIETTPIFIGNTKVIKNLLYKLNDIMFDDMKDIKVRILTSDSKTSGYREVLVSSENLNSIDGINLSSYVKLMVELPANKVINNIEIFIEYMSTDEYAPIEKDVTNGSYTSKVLDAQFNERYLIKALSIEDNNLDINNYTFQIRASKENDDETVWTDWKDIELDSNLTISNRVVFTDYRYFQFRVLLKGVGASIKINHIDLEVI